MAIHLGVGACGNFLYLFYVSTGVVFADPVQVTILLRMVKAVLPSIGESEAY